jgi:glucokinase
MILAGDIGGTSTRLGVFEPAHPRPKQIAAHVFKTLEFPDLISMIGSFCEASSIERKRIDRACFGVAGPVIDDAARLTNVPWMVDGRAIARALTLPAVIIINDLVAMGYSVPVLEDSELHTIQRGEPIPDGNISLVAAGTGLGIALLHNVKGRFIPSPSEGGHADFAARTEREMVLVRDLTARFGRAEVEHVVSGRGLLNIHRAIHRQPCAAGVNLDDPEAAADISTAALEGRCPGCSDVLDLFVEAYGAEAGNLALGVVATAGVYIGGGIAPKILPALESGGFLKAFRAKGTFAPMMEKMPVKIIMNSESGLIGAAVRCAVL